MWRDRSQTCSSLTLRPREPQTLKDSDAEICRTNTQKHVNTEKHRPRNMQTQKHVNVETHGRRNTQTQKHVEAETSRRRNTWNVINFISETQSCIENLAMVGARNNVLRRTTRTKISRVTVLAALAVFLLSWGTGAAAVASLENTGIGRPIFYTSNFSKCSSEEETRSCSGSSITSSWPAHAAIYLPPDEWDSFTVTVRDTVSDTEGAALTFVCEDDLNGEESEDVYHVACLSDSPRYCSVYNKSLVLANKTRMFTTLPHSKWFSLSMYEYDDDILFVVESRQSSDENFIQISIRVHLAENWNSNYSVTVNCGPHTADNHRAVVDLNCLQGPKRTSWQFVEFNNSVDQLSPTAAPTTLVPSSGEMESSIAISLTPTHVIGTIAVCGLLVLLLCVLFGLWHCQRKKLSQRRTSYQHQVLQRQVQDETRQRQLDLRQAESQPQFQQQRQESEQESVANQVQTNSQGKRRFKPKTYIRPPRSDTQSSLNSNSTTTTYVPEENTSSPDYVNIPLPNISSIAAPSQPVPFSMTEESTMRRLMDDGGVTGPYWFHSSRKPDPKTALRIYSV